MACLGLSGSVLGRQLRNSWRTWDTLCLLAGWPAGLHKGWMGTSLVLLEQGHAYFGFPGYSCCRVQGSPAEVSHDAVHGLVML